MYTVKRCENSILNAFDKQWEKADVAKIETLNWKQEFPRTVNACAKLMYDEKAMYIRLETDEKPLLITQTERNSPVCEDSCMEFFFKGNKDDARYFNFEFNAMGTMYLNFRTSRYDGEPPVENADYFNVQSLITADKWVLFFAVPFEFLNKYYGSYTKHMLGNFYKCGNVKHYLTYYPIETPAPDFHRPEYFGDIVLE